MVNYNNYNIMYYINYSSFFLQSLPGFCDCWISCKIKQTSQFSLELANFCNCRRFSRFCVRCIPWPHRNVHGQRKVVSHFENGINSLAFLSCPITRTTLDKRTEGGMNPRYSFGLRCAGPFICSGRSSGLLSIMQHRYTQRWEIQWNK